MKVWKGWTLVSSRGALIVDQFKEPFLWKRRSDAEECKEGDWKVVRCELRTTLTLGAPE